MVPLSNRNHRTQGRRIHGLDFPEPVTKNCESCGKEFLQMRRIILPCCDECNAVKLAAWQASYTPPKPLPRVDGNRPRKPRTCKWSNWVKVETTPVVLTPEQKVAELSKQMHALMALMAEAEKEVKG